MKTISKRFLKGALAMLLAVIMLFGSCISGIAAVVDNAATSAVDHTGGYVYFLKPSTWTESKVMMFIGHDSYTSVFEMTKVSNTDNLYRYSMGSWGGATYVAFANASSLWGGGNWGPSNRTNAPHYTNVYNNYGFNSGSYYVCVPASTSNNAGISINYKSSVSGLNLTTTATACYADAGSTTYKTGTAGGTSTVKGYYMSAYNTASTRSASASATLAPGSTATFTATPATGYEFVGWSTSSSESGIVSTDTTYNFKYDISYTGKTLYALFKQAGYSYTVTAGEGGTITSATSGTATSATITATPNTGYEFAGWTTTNGSVANTSSATTTFTPTANNAVAHATFKLKEYPLTINESGATGGTFTIDGSAFTSGSNVTHGSHTLGVTAPSGYLIKTLNGNAVGLATGTATFNVTEATTIDVVYEPEINCTTSFADDSDMNLALGGTQTRTATLVDCENGGTVVYSSSDPSVATVDSNGKVTALKAGSTTITAQCSKNCAGSSATYNVTVHKPTVVVNTVTVDVNGTATVKPEITAYEPVGDYSFVYESHASNSDFYALTEDGVVTGQKPTGAIAEVMMYYNDTFVLTKTFAVKVNEPVASLNKDSLKLLTGQTAQLSVTSTPDFESVAWSPDSVVTVNTSGTVSTTSTTGTGTVTATVKYNEFYSKELTCDVTVSSPVLTASEESLIINFGGGVTTGTVTVSNNDEAGADGTDAVDSKYEVVSANEEIATAVIDENGVVTVEAKSIGSTTLTISYRGVEKDITVKVSDVKYTANAKQVAIGNYGTGVTVFGTVTLSANGESATLGSSFDNGTSITYKASPTANYVFDGFYSDVDCNDLLTHNAEYTTTLSADTTVYALFARRQYMAFDQNNTSDYKELTYDVSDRSFKLATTLSGGDSTADSIAKGAWFRMTNTLTDWTGTSSYAHFDSSFNVTFNQKALDASIAWDNQNLSSWVLSTSGATDAAITFILTPTGNSAIDVSAQVGVAGGANSVFLSSGRLDLPGSYNAAVFEANIKYTHDGVVNPSDVYVDNEGENREKYRKLTLADPQTVSFEVEITGTAASRYYVETFVVYYIDSKSYEIVTPNSLGNNKYNGALYVDGPCYIVPIYFLTEEYATANDLSQIDVYFDANAIKDKAWGPFVACYAWGSNAVEYTGGWSGQMMIPSEDGTSFYTMITVPSATNTTAGSKPVGVTFNNYTQSTVPGSNPGAFGISATQYQCYDYREPITLYEEGFEVITFVAKTSTDGYHGDRANGVTSNNVNASSTASSFDFDYLYSRDGVTPMDLNGEAIEDPKAIENADYYIVAKGDITYDPNGTKYIAATDYDADWAVDWYVFGSNGNYITHILSDAMYNTYSDDGTTYLEQKLGLTHETASGKTIAISYEHENNAGHQTSYDGQWYGNMLDDDVNGNVVVGLIDDNDNFNIDTVDPTNDADYGAGWLVAEEERDGFTVGEKYASLPISLDYGISSLTADSKDGYRFVGWYTYANGSYTKISSAVNYRSYINNDTTYYAMFKKLGDDEVVINHLVYNNPNDPDIPSHGGVSEMMVEVYDSNGNLVQTGSAPSTSISTAVFIPEFNSATNSYEEYTIKIKTIPLMNGEFYAWYTDSYTADGTKTYEEILVEDGMIGSKTEVTSEFTYVYDPDSPVKSINIYSDIFRVSNKADFIYKYYNRFGAVCTYTVRDVLLTDDECLGYYGNEGNAYYPTYLTAYTMDNGKGEVTVYGEDRYNEYINNGYSLVDSYNKVQAYAPSADVTEAFDQNINWVVEGAVLTPAKSQVTLWANQVPAQYTITYTMPDANNGLVEGTFSDAGYYNELTEITAPQTNANGEKFSYWYEPATGQILSYFLYYNYRIVENKTIEAVYGKEVQDWTPSINSVTYTREYQDTSDIIYTDFLLAYNSKDGLVLNDVKEEMNIQYGLLMVMDPTYSYNGEGEVEFLDPTEANLKTAALYGKNKLIDGIRYYNFDLTSYDLTNFNRCDYFKSFNNKDTTNNFKGVAYTCVAYIIVDGTVYLSDSVDVNFYDLATTPVEQLNN